jgi:selT/selW/selH-like putative selenoprotein
VEAEVKASFPDATVKLIEGGGGIFDVTCNGKLVYSKQNIEGQRFPDVGEITRLIKQ